MIFQKGQRSAAQCSQEEGLDNGQERKEEKAGEVSVWCPHETKTTHVSLTLLTQGGETRLKVHRAHKKAKVLN